MQMSTLDSYQYSNNTTMLCIWRERDVGRLHESGYTKRMKKKKTVFNQCSIFHLQKARSNARRPETAKIR